MKEILMLILTLLNGPNEDIIAKVYYAPYNLRLESTEVAFRHARSFIASNHSEVIKYGLDLDLEKEHVQLGLVETRGTEKNVAILYLTETLLFLSEDDLKRRIDSFSKMFNSNTPRVSQNQTVNWFSPAIYIGIFDKSGHEICYIFVERDRHVVSDFSSVGRISGFEVDSALIIEFTKELLRSRHIQDEFRIDLP